MAVWIPVGVLVVMYQGLFCRAKLGHFFNAGILAIDLVIGWLFAQNPLCPHGLLANCGKWLFALFCPILWVIGVCFDACRRRKSKAEGIEEDVPAADENFKEVKVSDSVSVLAAKFSEGLETSCAMTVIRGDNWVMFFNPIFAPLHIYKKYAEGKQRA